MFGLNVVDKFLFELYAHYLRLKENYQSYRAQIQCVGKLRISAFQCIADELCNISYYFFEILFLKLHEI